MSEQASPFGAAQRARWAIAGLLALVVACATVFALIVLDDATRTPGSLGGEVGMMGIPPVIVLGVLAFGGCLGRAFVPSAVVQRGRAGRFAWGVALVLLGVLLCLPTQLFCIALPFGVAALASGIALLVSTRR